VGDQKRKSNRRQQKTKSVKPSGPSEQRDQQSNSVNSIQRLNCTYTNVDTFLNKRNEFSHYVAIEKPDIICLVEILPKNTKFSVNAPEIQVNGYDCFSNINDKDCRRGVAIYVKKSLGAVPSKLKESFNFEESCWCEVPLRDSDRLYIGGIYRSPNSNDENNKNLNEALSSLPAKSHMLIMGDFNYPEIDWLEESTPPDVRQRATQFMEAVRDSFMVQHVKDPTHYRGNQTPNLLDLVFTNEEGMISKVSHNAPLGKSHHQVLQFNYLCYSDQKQKEPRLNLKKGDYNKLRSRLSENNWEELKATNLSNPKRLRLNQ
jgi:exonuclease III